MKCPNDECFCDGSCFDNEQFKKTWEWYEEMCDDLGLSNDTNMTDESEWTLNNRTIKV